MSEEDMKIIREIHEVLVGTLDKPGFIESTRSEFRKVDYRLSKLEKAKAVGAGFVISILTVVVGNLFV